MKILYLTHRLPYAPNRGDRLRAYHMVRHLARRHQVHVASFVHDADEASQAAGLASQVASVTVARVGRLRGLARGVAALGRGTPLTHALLDARGFRRQLTDLAARVQPDLVVALCSGMARFALAPPLAGVPFVLDMVDVDSAKWAVLGRTARAPKAWIYRREARRLAAFERIAADAARATLVVNERERLALIDVGAAPDRIAVVPNGIEMESLRPPRPPEARPRVVFCGVMNYEPNEDAAVWLAEEIWPLVLRARPDAQLTLVGSHPTRRILNAAARSSSIEVTGSVPDVRPMLWRAAVSVAPMTVARGIQNKVLEAVAAGLPTVVTSAVFEGLPPEVTPACARADTAEAFAGAVLRLLAQPAEARRALAASATLDAIDWPHRLAVLDAVLAEATVDVDDRARARQAAWLGACQGTTTA
jgi:sugar transferase (PEP-CTERM/EpsH1 system associated)